MTLTVPGLGCPHPNAITTGSHHLAVTFTSAGVENLTGSAAAANTLFVQGDGSATDLCQWLEDTLNTNTAGETLTVTLHSGGNGRISVTGDDTDNIIGITFNGTEVLPYHFGWATSTATTSVVFGSGDYSGQYRAPSLWIPNEVDFGGLRTRTDGVVSQAGDDGSADIDIYSGHRRSEHILLGVYGALVRQTLATDSDHIGNVSGLTSGDTNAALDAWLEFYHGLLGGSAPTLRWTPDIVDTPGTWRNVRLTDPELIAGVEAWIENTNDAPLFHDLRLMLSEV